MEIYLLVVGIILSLLSFFFRDDLPYSNDKEKRKIESIVFAMMRYGGLFLVAISLVMLFL